jgi:DNA-binding GntR family transcriptional regulator
VNKAGATQPPAAIAAKATKRADTAAARASGDLVSGIDKAVFAPARRSSTNSRVAERVYRRLRRAIIEGEIPARSRMIELELAAALGASRTPVREAISRLTSDHLVTPLANGGVEVVDTLRELDDIYCIREALEGSAARLAAERITDAELARLAELVEATRNAPLNGFELRVRINHEFHDVITRASRSERLVAMVASFREFFLSERTLEQYDARDSARALAHHTEILDALRVRDGRRVERLVRRHLEHDRRVTKARQR